MKERFSILLGVLAAAYLVWGIFVPRLAPTTIERPLSTVAAPEGYLALQQWLARSGIRTHSLREPPGTLTDPAGPFSRPGHILITVMPHHAGLDRDAMNAMLDWVSDGNTLVIMAGLNDTPLWTASANTQDLLANFTYLTSLNAEYRPADVDDEAVAGAPPVTSVTSTQPPTAPTEFSLSALPGHWLTSGVRELAATSALPSGPWDIEPDAGAPAFSLARDTEADVDALLITNLGKGAVVVSTFASLWQNSVIGRRDNRQLLLNLLAHHLGPSGTVIFDDYHHGLTTLYDAKAFFADPRLARTVFLLLGFWLVYAVFADSRLGPVVEPECTAGSTAFARTMGGFLARKVAPSDAGLRLVENFLAHVRPYVAAGTAESVWQRIGAAPRMDPELAEALSRDHARLVAGRRVDLQQLQRRLRAARGAFS